MNAQLEFYVLSSSYMKKRKNLGKKKAQKWLNAFFSEIVTELEIERIGVFVYAVEPGTAYNRFTPWRRILKLTGWHWRLHTEKKSWWKWIREFFEIAHANGVKIVPVLLPGAYGEIPFKKNTNGVKNYLDEKAKEYQKAYLLRLMLLHKSIFKSGRNCRFTNEMAHNGNWNRGHTLGAWHQWIYETIKHILPLNRIGNDTTFSDWIAGYLAEEHMSADGETWIGKVEYDRQMWIEQHNIGTIKMLTAPVEEGSDKNLWDDVINGSGWKKFWISSDGSGDGSGYKIPNTGFTNSTYDELYALAFKCWTETNSQIVIIDLPKEVFEWKGNILVENFNLLDTDRLKALKDAWKDAHA